MNGKRTRKGKGNTCLFWHGNRHRLFLFLCFFIASDLGAQNIPVQQLRGIVTDQVLNTPVQGATVTLVLLNRSVITNEKGEFRFDKVPVGEQQLLITSVGYREAFLANITINAGKEMVLTVSLENSVSANDAITVKATHRKNKPLNDMSAVSARAFTVEETQKYAAAVNDPLRMATGFPGVMVADDGNNNIIIRGNSPTGLLWRMEGVDIPNPNHFSSTGSSGGGISILSTQLLSNSDFITGAFASEYGNALSGVFDLKLRKGNDEKKEYTLQAGLLGLNIAAEGPLRSSYGGSYLVNYRYSTLELLNKMGIPLEGGSTNFQDLAYHIWLPTRKWGNFSWFGFGGLSSQNEKALMDSSKWESRFDRYHSEFISNTGASGLTHQIMVSGKTSLRSAVSFSYNRIEDRYRYVENDYSLKDEYDDNFKTRKWTIHSTLNHKFSSRASIRAGADIGFISFDYFQRSRENETAPLKEVIDSRDATQIVQGFIQAQYKPANQLTLNAGMHYLQLLYNNSASLEPRASLKWQVNKTNSLALGYGLHSQVQALGVYFAQVKDGSGNAIYPNKKLGLTKAHHYVFSWQHSFSRDLALKAELYYQQLFNVPVGVGDSSSFSVLNVQSEYVTDPLVNNGKGRNYGLELSVEKYLSRNYYYTLSSSLYNSTYSGADGVERDTRFNGKYLFNLVAGKEFLSPAKPKIFGINLKAIYAGGLRNTPIDLERSVSEGYAVYREQEAFRLQNAPYFRTDLRVSMKWNRKNLTSTLSLDIQNLTNRLNVYGQWFNSEKNKVETTYQNGLIPVLNYKVEF